jgi:hypothetical protein
MPFKSKAQRAWMFANKPEMAKEWASETPTNAQLPERVKPQAGKTPRRKPYKAPGGSGGFQQ